MMSRPVILTVDDDREGLAAIRRELDKRYGDDYRIECVDSPEQALAELAGWCEAGVEIPLILSDMWMPQMSGIEFLARARDLYPKARRAVVIDFGDRSAAEPLLQAMAMSEVDAYVSRPWGSPDEAFHRFVTESLAEWAETSRPGHVVVQLVGQQWAPRCHELRDLLNRNRVPHAFYDEASPRGQALLRLVSDREIEYPVVLLANAEVLMNPSNSELSDAIQNLTMLDVTSPVEARTFDVVVVGAGPAGLSAAVYAASEGLGTLVVEREALGGQAGTSALVRNYLGFPTGISGGDLAARAYRQAWTFGADFLIGREVTGLEQHDGGLSLTLSDGRRIDSRAVVLAVGINYRRLEVPDLTKFTNAGVFYGAAVSEARGMAGQQVYVVGGGNSAGQAAMHLAKYAGHVTIVVRSPSLARSMSDYLIKQIDAEETIDVRLNTEVVGGGGDYRLRWLELARRGTSGKERVDAGGLFVLIGGTPHTGWLPAGIVCDARGYVVTGQDLLVGEPYGGAWPLERQPFPVETSMPGVFAIGDVRHGAVKRVASAVGEGSIAISYLYRYLNTTQDARYRFAATDSG
jgi:thioredoxin reductase (NADPH)